MPSRLRDGSHKRILADKSERVAHVAAEDFLSRYLSGVLPYVQRHMTGVGGGGGGKCPGLGVSKYNTIRDLCKE